MRLAAGVAFAVLGLVASQARAADPSIFEVFKAACFDTRADPQKAVAALGPGWSDAGVAPSDGRAVQVRKVKTVGADQWELMVIQRDLPKGADQTPFPKRMRMCAVTTSAKASGLTASVRTLMGVAPNGKARGGLAWGYADEPAGRKFFASDTAAETNAWLAKAPLVVVMATTAPQGEGAAFTEVRRLGD